MRVGSATTCLLFSLAWATGAVAREFTVFNNCSFSVWPAVMLSPTFSRITSTSTGLARSTRTRPSPQAHGPNIPPAGCKLLSPRPCSKCPTIGCQAASGDAATATSARQIQGVPPATLAEFTLGINGAPDSYDVSVVDGQNLPMRILNNKGCPTPDCPVDLVKNCPEPLRAPLDANGNAVGCKTACSAGLAGYDDSPYCCSGSYASPEKCPSSGVKYYDYFKGNCPKSYAFAFDDSTALVSCDSSRRADYTVVFCPSH